MNKRFDHNGFTLVELVISIALIVGVITLATNASIFNNSALKEGSTQQTLQSDVREIVNFISNEVTYATDIEILTGLPTTFDTHKRYIYIEDGVVYHKNEVDDPVAMMGITKDPVYSLEFTKTGNTTVGYTLGEVAGDRSYEIENEIECVNLKGNQASERISGLVGPVISYAYRSTDKDFLSFVFKASDNPDALSVDIAGNITQDSVYLYVPAGTDISDLIPTFSISGVKAEVSEIAQTSGSTHNDYSSGSVIYTVTAQDGSTKDYTVIVDVLPDTPPAADAVRIIASDPDGTITPVAWDTSTLTASFTFISNGNGNEGTSLYRWYYSDAEDGTYTLIPSATDHTMSAEFYTNQWVKFEVKPVSEFGTSGGWVESTPVFINPSSDNFLWKRMVEDLWYIYSTETERELFDQALEDAGQPPYTTKVVIRDELESKDPDFKLSADVVNNSIVVEGKTHIDGVQWAIDLTEYASDLDSYSIVFDTVLFRGREEGLNYTTDGWGMALGANVNSENKDASYMFQFDPGASGYVIRRNNFNHHVIPDMGVKQTGVTNSGSYATYNPSEIVSDGFTWSGSNSNSNSAWYSSNYSARITMQRQLDKSYVFSVKIWRTMDGEENASEEMWFGDFGAVTYNGNTFSGQAPAVGYSGDENTNKTLYGFANNIEDDNYTYLGIRSWQNGGDRYKAEFNNLTLEDGFKMNIESAKFLVDKDLAGNDVCNKILIKFDQAIRVDDFDATLMDFNDTFGEIENISTMPMTDDSIIVAFDEYIDTSDVYSDDGIDGNTLSRGSVRAMYAGDVTIVNGINFTTVGDEHMPYYRIRNIDTNTVLDVSGASMDDNGDVILWTAKEENENWENQLWSLIKDEDSEGYYIQNLNSNKVLTIIGNRRTREFDVVQHALSSNSEYHQIWYLTDYDSSTNAYKIRSEDVDERNRWTSYRYLDRYNSGSTDVYANNSSSSNSQRWILEAIYVEE